MVEYNILLSFLYLGADGRAHDWFGQPRILDNEVDKRRDRVMGRYIPGPDFQSKCQSVGNQ